MIETFSQSAVGENRRRLFVYNGGFLTQKRTRRILDLAGFDIKIGAPSAGDAIGVWGQSPTAPRGEAMAIRTDIPVIRVEDAFLRSVKTGRDGEDALGLVIDRDGVHFDPSRKSGLERLLTEHPLDDTVLLNRARDGIAALRRHHLSKYNTSDPTIAAPKPGYILVIDQTRGDASVTASGANLNTFREMLYYAQEEHPTARIIIKTHPETAAGHRDGYFSKDDETDRISVIDSAVSPYHLFDGAIAVYTVSSQMGFEAILTGHKPVVFGQPFYAGWGLSDDRKPLDRRQRKLTRNQLFAAAMLLYPTYYDPYHDTLCTFEETVQTLAARARAYREDHQGWVASDMSAWKKPHLQSFFGREEKVIFASGDIAMAQAAQNDHRLMVWASKGFHGIHTDRTTLVEDGFLRSRGLGAKLTPPLSLVPDRQGIYYDPTRPSDLEDHIAHAAENLTDQERDRAKRLRAAIIAGDLTKYNLAGQTPLPSLEPGRVILVPGQVEDDASVRLGSKTITTNEALLKTVRQANPAAIILYKPHPDVEAGLRPGKVTNATLFADHILTDTPAAAAISAADEVWTLTSLIGFEALIRDKPVTCLGTPFYAGWGLTTDRDMPLPRRCATPDIIALIHAVLIDYPRYHDPETDAACPPEIIVARLKNEKPIKRSRTNKLLSRLQSGLSPLSGLWRK